MTIQQQLGDWYPALIPVLDEPWFEQLGRYLGGVNPKALCPQVDDIFKAYLLCPPLKVKVVIIGQDPYHDGSAMGLSFSTHHKITPSLEVIFRELALEGYPRTDPDLTDWAEQGVFLLNAVLTTTMGRAGAHVKWGWEKFTARTLGIVAKFKRPIVLMAWGKDAQKILDLMNKVWSPGGDRLMLTAHHPQAENYNPANKFTGCNHFKTANQWLSKNGIESIRWADKTHYHAQTDKSEGTDGVAGVDQSAPPANGTGFPVQTDLPF